MQRRDVQNEEHLTGTQEQEQQRHVIWHVGKKIWRHSVSHAPITKKHSVYSYETIMFTLPIFRLNKIQF